MVKPFQSEQTNHKTCVCNAGGHEQDGEEQGDATPGGGDTRSTFAWRKEKEGRTSERGWPRRGNEEASSLLLPACLVITP